MSQEFIDQLAQKLQTIGTLHAVGETWISIDSTIPAGGIPFLGQLVNRSVWADLFSWATAQGKVKTDAEWQTYASANGGNCPFYSDGDGSTTFRMPCIRSYLKGADTLDGAGGYTAEGLPNIAGTFQGRPHMSGSTSWGGSLVEETTGAFTLKIHGGNAENKGTTESSTKSTNDIVTFNASLANPIYGNSDHVIPETYSVLIGAYAVGIATNVGSADATQFLAGLSTVEARLGQFDRLTTDGDALKWNDAEVVTAYEPGDTVTLEIAYGGYLSNASKEIIVFATFERPVNASSISVSDCYFTARYEGTYLANKITDTSYISSIEFRQNGLRVVFYKSSGWHTKNNVSVGIAGSVTVTFS